MRVESLILDFIKPGTGSRAMAMMLHNGSVFYFINCTSGAKRFGKNAIVKSRAEAIQYMNRIIHRATERGLTSVSLVRDFADISEGQILAVTKALVDGYDSDVAQSMETALARMKVNDFASVTEFDKYITSKAAIELEKFEEKIERELVEITTMGSAERKWLDPRTGEYVSSPTMVKLKEVANYPSEQHITKEMIDGSNFANAPAKVAESPSDLSKKREEAGFGSW